MRHPIWTRSILARQPQIRYQAGRHLDELRIDGLGYEERAQNQGEAAESVAYFFQTLALTGHGRSRHVLESSPDHHEHRGHGGQSYKQIDGVLDICLEINAIYRSSIWCRSSPFRHLCTATVPTAHSCYLLGLTRYLGRMSETERRSPQKMKQLIIAVASSLFLFVFFMLLKCYGRRCCRLAGAESRNKGSVGPLKYIIYSARVQRYVLKVRNAIRRPQDDGLAGSQLRMIRAIDGPVQSQIIFETFEQKLKP